MRGIGMKYDRPNKVAARSRILEAARGRYTSLLALPGPHALCVQDMMQRGIVTTETRQQWIEMRLSTHEFQRELAKKLNLSVTFYNGELENYIINNKIDLVNIDLESTVTCNLAQWVEEEISQNLLSNSFIIVTYTQWARNNEFLNFFFNKLQRDDELWGYYQLVAKQMHSVHTTEIIQSVILRFAFGSLNVEQIPMISYKDKQYTMITTAFRLLDNDSPMTIFPSILPFCDEYKGLPKRIIMRGEEETLYKKIKDEISSMGLTLSRNHENYWQIKRPQCVEPIGVYRNLGDIAKRFIV